MKADEAAAIVEAVADSIYRTPGQFSQSVNITGMKGTPGSPIVGHAVGGAPGSTTIGVSSRVTVGDISQVQGGHDGEIVQALRSLASEIRKPDPDRGRLRQLLNFPWFPPVIVALVNAAASRVGLP